MKYLYTHHINFRRPELLGFIVALKKFIINFVIMECQVLSCKQKCLKRLSEIRMAYPKGFLLVIAMILFSNLSVDAQHFSFIEIENCSNITTDNYLKPQVNFYASEFDQTKNFGVYYFLLLNENWGQAYAGIQFKPFNWLKLSLGAGLENNVNPYRFNISLFIFKNKISWMQIYEYGGSDFGIIFC